MPDEIQPEILAKSHNIVVVAAAGCGKTELITRAVNFTKGKELILTHTHAGVNSILNRLKKYCITPKKFSVETIASFCLRYSLAYPQFTDFHIEEDKPINYKKATVGACRLFETIWGGKILQESFSGIYVDEYQDCSVSQHELILRLREILPLRILGDPLQGIFDFISDDSLVDWENGVSKLFSHAELFYPWRWHKNNPDLGEWLSSVRKKIENKEIIDFRELPINCTHMIVSPEEQRNICFQSLKHKEPTVAIHKWSEEAHSFAKRLSGSFSSMEEIECKDLIKFCKSFEENDGNSLVLDLIKFCSKCFTVVSTELAQIKKLFEENRESSRLKVNRPIYELLISLKNEKNWVIFIEVLNLISNIKDANNTRREIWYEMNRALKEKIIHPDKKLHVIAANNRSITSQIGRKQYRYIVSRTTLIKGLEYDHSILLNADELSPKELYVAMTRGSKRLSVLSENTYIEFQ